MTSHDNHDNQSRFSQELEDNDDFIGAERQWTEIIENFNSPNFRTTNPGNKVLLARAYSNRGNTRLSLQKTREAILDYSESIDLVPEKGEFWLARGVAFEVRVFVCVCWCFFFGIDRPDQLTNEQTSVVAGKSVCVCVWVLVFLF